MTANFLFWGPDSKSTFLLGTGCMPLAGITGWSCPFATCDLPALLFPVFTNRVLDLLLETKV